MRAVEACPHRRPRCGGPADCALLHLLAGPGAAAAGLCRVGPDACAACCAAPPPAPGRLNPVVASLLARTAERVGAAGGLPGCDAARADDLRRRAHRELQIVVPVAD